MSFFSIRGSYQYGTFSNDATFTDITTPVISTYSTAAQTNYTVGGAVSIPLDGLFDLAPRVRRQKLLVKTAQLEKEMKFEELKREIIQLYVTANAQLNTLKLRAEAVVLETAQYEITEKDFTNGTIESKELSNQKSTQSHAIENYENSKAELNKSLMILEVITHSTIIKK